ncbi:MAG: endonuclease VIII [Sandaracinus sp.]|nr:endonuclease VIII [Sandaracinus sp.]
MPEGPEIRRAADRVQAAVARQPLEVELHVPSLAGRELEGRTITHVETRGKAMLTHFEGGPVLYSHNQLYGRWYVVRRGTSPRTSRSLRVAFHAPKKSAMLYSATELEWLSPDALDAHPFLAKLGPDLLAPTTTIDAIDARLSERRFARRALASLYLDQGFLAGLGNYLRAEILFVAGLHPSRRPGELDASRRRALAEATLEVTLRSYRTGGVTIDARREAGLVEEGVPRRARRHYVYGRAGHACRLCETPIERVELGGRHVFVCPRCQG